MTGTIRTLRVDKGFGFIKSEAGQEISFTKALSMARASPICARVMESSSRLRTARRVRGRRTSSAPRRKRTELADRRRKRTNDEWNHFKGDLG